MHRPAYPTLTAESGAVAVDLGSGPSLTKDGPKGVQRPATAVDRFSTFSMMNAPPPASPAAVIVCIAPSWPGPPAPLRIHHRRTNHRGPRVPRITPAPGASLFPRAALRAVRATPRPDAVVQAGELALGVSVVKSRRWLVTGGLGRNGAG